MASYAVADDVLLRAGRFAGFFTVQGKRPNLADLESLIADTSAEIDAAVRALSLDPATMTQGVKDAFRDLNAYGALYRGLSAVDGRGDAMKDRIDEARSIWESAMGNPAGTKDGSISKGTFPAIRQLLAEQGGGGQVATGGSFWEHEPEYGSNAQVVAEAQTIQLPQAPAFRKNQAL